MHTLYHCDHCPTHTGSADADTMLDHEKACEWNPANKTCCTCRHPEYTPEYRGKLSPWKCRLWNDRTFRKGCPTWEAMIKP